VHSPPLSTLPKLWSFSRATQANLILKTEQGCKRHHNHAFESQLSSNFQRFDITPAPTPGSIRCLQPQASRTSTAIEQRIGGLAIEDLQFIVYLVLTHVAASGGRRERFLFYLLLQLERPWRKHYVLRSAR